MNDSGHSVPVVRRQQPTHVLEHEPAGSWLHSANKVADVIEEPPVVVGAGALAGEGNGLARETAAQDVDRLGALADEVADIRHTRGESCGEDTRRGRVDLRAPREIGVEELLDGEVEPAHARAERAELHGSPRITPSSASNATCRQ